MRTSSCMWWLVAASPNARPPVLRARADVRGRGGRHRAAAGQGRGGRRGRRHRRRRGRHRAAAGRGRGGRRGGRRGRRRGQATGSESLAYLPPVLVARTGGQLSRYRAAAGHGRRRGQATGRQSQAYLPPVLVARTGGRRRGRHRAATGRGRGGRRGGRRARRRGQATGSESLAYLPPVLVARTGGRPWRRATATAAPPAVRLHRCDRRGLLRTCSRSRSRRAGPQSRPPVPVGMRLLPRDDGVGEAERNREKTLSAPEGSAARAAARCSQERINGSHSRLSAQPRIAKRPVPREVQADEGNGGPTDVAGREERLAC